MSDERYQQRQQRVKEKVGRVRGLHAEKRIQVQRIFQP